MREVKKQSLSESALLHLLPGVLLAAFLALFSYMFRDRGVPAIFFLQVGVFFVMIPTMYAIARRYQKIEGLSSIKDLVRPRQKVPWYEFALWTVLIFVFAALVLTLAGKSINPALKSALFGWIPNWLDITDIFARPTAYSNSWRLIVWVFGLIATSIVGPIVEEFYFRGFLLPRIRGKVIGPVLWGACLFALYHVFSLWLVPARIIALIPLVYITLKKRNIGIAIAAHCILNIAGDSISSLPILLG